MHHLGLAMLLLWTVMATAAQENSTDSRNSKGSGAPLSAAQLLGDIHGKDENKKHSAIDMLGRISGERSDLKQVAIDLLDDKDAKVQHAAVKACRALNTAEAIPTLRKMLKGGKRFHFTRGNFDGLSPDIRELHMEVASALVQFRDSDSMDELLSRDEIMGFSGFGGPLVGQYGAQILPKVVALARKGDMRKHGALQAISWMRDEAAVSQLASLVEDRDPEIAAAATNALGRIAPKANRTNRKLVEDALDKAVASKDEYVRMNAYEAEIQNRDSAAFPVTFDMIMKEKGVARLHIFYGLMNSNRKDMVPVLKRFIEEDEKEHPNSTTDRAVAAQTIYRLTGERAPYKGLEIDRRIYRDPYDPDH